MTIQKKIAEYCMSKGSIEMNNDLKYALNHIIMAKCALLGDFEKCHKINILLDSEHVDEWMSEWYLETIKQQLV